MFGQKVARESTDSMDKRPMVNPASDEGRAGHGHPAAGHGASGHLAHGAGPKNTEGPLFKFIVTVCLIICGAAMTLIIKIQDEHCLQYCEGDSTPSPGDHSFLPSEGFTTASSMHAAASTSGSGSGSEHHDPHYFHQPFIQLAQMGLGQLLSLGFFNMYKPRPQPDGTIFRDPTFKEFFPSAAAASTFDALAEVFVILGLSFTNASTAEMMKATLVVFCGLFSMKFFPGFRLTIRQWIATFSMMTGAALVIARQYIFNTSGEDSLIEVAGACLVLLAQLCYAGQFVVEERLVDATKLQKTHVNKALLVFCEGIVSILAAIVLQVPWGFIMGWDYFMSDAKAYFTEPILWATGIGLSFAVAGFDLFGLATAETMGSDRRAVITASFQVVIVWSLSVVFGLEQFLPPADYLALAGFVIIFFSGIYYAFSSASKDTPRNIHGLHVGDDDETKPLLVNSSDRYDETRASTTSLPTDVEKA